MCICGCRGGGPGRMVSNLGEWAFPDVQLSRLSHDPLTIHQVFSPENYAFDGL